MRITRTEQKHASHRPVVDQWSVGGEISEIPQDKFHSTQDLVKAELPLHGRRGTYSFISHPAGESTWSDKAKESLKGLGLGVAGGAVTSLMLTELTSGISNIAPRLMFKDPDTLVTLLIPTISMGLVGAVLGFAIESSDRGNRISGTFQRGDDQLLFHPDRADQTVNLTNYQHAKVPEPDQDSERQYGSQWWKPSLTRSLTPSESAKLKS